jgi:cell volume regulation protein A
MHMPLVAGLLVGAALGCTSSTVVLPVLQQLEAGAPVRATLMLEASLGDVLAVLTVDLLVGLHAQSGSLVQGLAYKLFLQVGVALLFAVTAGVLWSRLLPALSEQRFWQVLTFSTVLVLYAGMEALGANGLIAVLGFGLTISNFPGIDPGLGLTGTVATSAESQQALLTFHSELAFLVRTFFFVLIGAIAELGTFRQHPLLIAGTLAGLFLARWLAVRFSRWSWKEIGPEGQEAILWMLPRGLITVVLAIEVTEARPAQLSFLPGLAFAVILATNLLLVLGSWRGRRPAHAGGAAASPRFMPEAQPAPLPASRAAGVRTSPRHGALVNAALLVLLGLGALVLWSSSSFSHARKAQIENWVRLRWHGDSNRGSEPR